MRLERLAWLPPLAIVTKLVRYRCETTFSRLIEAVQLNQKNLCEGNAGLQATLRRLKEDNIAVVVTRDQELRDQREEYSNQQMED